jgi:hypothetical protein
VNLVADIITIPKYNSRINMVAVNPNVNVSREGLMVALISEAFPLIS